MIHNFRRFDRGGVYVGVNPRANKVKDFAHREDIGRHARLDQKIASQECFQATFSGDEIASRTYHECERKKPSGRAQGLGIQAGEHCQLTPDPICGICGSLQETGKDQNQGKAS